MLYKKIIAVFFFSEIHTQHINTLCGQNVEFVNIQPDGTFSNHGALKCSYWAINLFKFYLYPFSFLNTSHGT